METGYKLLEKLYEIHSPSRDEKNMINFIEEYCKELDVKVEKDTAGNLFITKGTDKTYPCIVAHMDQVQKKHSKDFKVIMLEDTIFAYSAKAKEQQGLGADDKNGIWIALELLRKEKALKCAFFVGEEIGCVGSNNCKLDFFENTRFCIQADRRNGNDLITEISGKICSDEFLEDIPYEKYGYKKTSGLSTDVGTLSRRNIGVSCINISCGYYKPHTDEECTSWKELNNALNFAREICGLKKTYKHKYEPIIITYCGGWGFNSYNPNYKNSWDDDWDNDWDNSNYPQNYSRRLKNETNKKIEYKSKIEERTIKSTFRKSIKRIIELYARYIWFDYEYATNVLPETFRDIKAEDAKKIFDEELIKFKTQKTKIKIDKDTNKIDITTI